MVLDIKHARGRDLLLELVAGADVLVENFRPGVMDALELSTSTTPASTAGASPAAAITPDAASVMVTVGWACAAAARRKWRLSSGNVASRSSTRS